MSFRALSSATGLSSEVSMLFTPLSQVSRDLEIVPSTISTLLALVNNLGATLANLAGSVTQASLLRLHFVSLATPVVNRPLNPRQPA
ncbi:hypothetical protein DFH09DRAFT_1370153 [Mycena vulgaris]|nr:hypothetical protein DFH09DRAFT_1370153 [Mycena vulgaris]